jgi:hypothetical protein
MSIPAWQYKLEEIEFKLRSSPELIVDWLLNNPVAKEIPEHVLKARLTKYGYKEPEPVQPRATQQRKTPAKRNRNNAE